MTTQFEGFAISPAGSRTQNAGRARRVVAAIRAVFVAWKHRRETSRAMMAMDDRMLSDIGITRGDLRSALAEPVWRDPTMRLTMLAVERRVARRAMAVEALEREWDRPQRRRGAGEPQPAQQPERQPPACCEAA